MLVLYVLHSGLCLTYLSCTPDIVEHHGQTVSLVGEIESRVILLLENVGLVSIYDDAGIWHIFGKKVVQPHTGVAGLAQPAPVRVAVEAMDSHNAVRH